MNNPEIQRLYLDGFAADYESAIVATQEGIYRVVNPMLAAAAQGATLLVGAGPLAHLEAGRAASVTALDYSESMLRQARQAGPARPVCADAGALPFDRGAFDTVILPFIVHHLAQDNVRETDRSVARVLAESTRVLRRGGRLIIVDMFLGQFVELVERTFYGTARFLLNSYGRPMMFFYSLANFTQLLKDNPLRIAKSERVDVRQPLVLTLLAPRRRISPRRHPAKFFYVECRKEP